MAEHPITPPPELVEQWLGEGFYQDYCSPFEHAIAQAARWGADQELEACCKTFEDIWDNKDLVTLSDVLRGLRAARRPKPPSLKEQALEALDRMDQLPTAEDQRTIRRALEALPDD